jgi:protein TonB
MYGCEATTAQSPGPAPTPIAVVQPAPVASRPAAETGNSLSVAQSTTQGPGLAPVATPASPAPPAPSVPPLTAPPARSY